MSYKNTKTKISGVFCLRKKYTHAHPHIVLLILLLFTTFHKLNFDALNYNSVALRIYLLKQFVM